MKKKWFFDPLIPLKYDLIMMDPPTRFETFTPFESAKGAQYPTMDDRWVRDLPVGDLASGNCLMWMWSTMSKLKASLEWMERYGFTYVTAGAWHKKTINNKTSVGTGFVLRSSAEVYLIGRIGKPKYKNRPQPGLIDTTDADTAYFDGLVDAVPEVIEGLRREHSRKPVQQYEILDALMGTDIPRCELFAREQVDGWDAWGNQTDHFEGIS